MTDTLITSVVNTPSDQIVKTSNTNTFTGANTFKGITKLGDGTTNYTQFSITGTLTMVGSATVFDDALGDLTKAKTVGTRVTLSDTENTMDFTSSATTSDYIYFNIQFPHKRKIGANIFPHIHWEQTSNATPNWLLQYRWQKNGSAKATSWVDYKMNTTNVFTYVSGTLNQISYGAAITPSGDGISDILEIRVVRDTANASNLFGGADGYTGTASATSMDIHIEVDTLGSESEYQK